MSILWVLIIISIFGVLVFLNTSSSNSADVREKYLDDLTKFLEGKKEKLEHPENSFKVIFHHDDREFVFEDIEDYGFQTSNYKGVLKRQTTSNLTMSFTERAKSMFRTGGQTVQDGWIDHSGEVRMRKPLNRFHLYTNNAEVATKLINDSEVFNVFSGFMNVNMRGHPIMSLEIIEGVITLCFHSRGNLKPDLIELRNNVTTIESFFDKLILVENKLSQLDSVNT
ncbi:MAG: hypothetical protein KAR05_07875 [Candidatus Omnitrophica bacterium]|nr:hypothetical protein [Candidatus Omnitrophota bacterium]MCK5590354.1 hypothetical protein [Candidatus Paceibacterota bacterium]